MRTLAAGLLVLGIWTGAAAAADPPGPLPPDETGATLPPPVEPGAQPIGQDRGLLSDVKAYVTAPARWGNPEWLGFGGALAAIAIAHSVDRQTAAPFLPAPGSRRPSNFDLQDIAPAAVLLAGTTAYGFVSDSPAGNRESLAMIEAAAFSGVTAFTLQHVAGRLGPLDSTDPNRFQPGTAGTFPSLHTTVAFAIGTVLAESGNDDYRWVRRVLGYGVGVLTSYERVRHNQHWLSDTVAGAALGTSTAFFTMHRRYPADAPGGMRGFSVQPLSGGAMLSYNMQL